MRVGGTACADPRAHLGGADQGRHTVEDYLSEDEQAQQLKTWFKENWIWLVAGIALGLGGIYGWQGYNRYLDTRSQAGAQRFQQMLEAFAASKNVEGMKLAGEIRAEYGRTPYADQADLVVARVHVEAGEFEKAAARLREVMEGADDPELRTVARVRLARVQLAQGNLDQALGTLDGAKAAGTEARVTELRGDVLLAKGDRAGALKAYQAARDAAARSRDAGLVDQELLELKIDDLAGAAPAK